MNRTGHNVELAARKEWWSARTPGAVVRSGIELQMQALGGVFASPRGGGLLERKPSDADRHTSSDATPVVAVIAPRIGSRADAWP